MYVHSSPFSFLPSFRSREVPCILCCTMVLDFSPSAMLFPPAELAGTLQPTTWRRCVCTGGWRQPGDGLQGRSDPPCRHAFPTSAAVAPLCKPYAAKPSTQVFTCAKVPNVCLPHSARLLLSFVCVKPVRRQSHKHISLSSKAPIFAAPQGQPMLKRRPLSGPRAPLVLFPSASSSR